MMIDRRTWRGVWLVACFLLTLNGHPAGFLEIRGSYFWDTALGEHFVPRGIAYQAWNPPVGANQSFAQLDYDLLEFKKMHANSVRCEMVWGELEVAEGVHDWRKPDHLVAEAERLGLRLFVLIGFQYPPAWFPKHLRGINAEGLTPARMRLLAESAPEAAFEHFPPRARTALLKAAPEEFRAAAAQALVDGAREGAVTNVLRQLELRLPPLVAEGMTRVLISDVINYEHPEARAAYARHLATVAARYKNSTAVGGWIMGNEYAYFDLWEDPIIYGVHRFLGYDAVSQESFRKYLEGEYRTNIAALNANWRTSFADFASVEMPLEYPLERDNPAYFDLIQWRKSSIGSFVAVGTSAARAVDPKHLQTYSMVGGIFSGRDANHTCEDARAIVARCREAGAPLDFWSINNYANAAIGSEMRSADFGVGKYQAESGLPVMISETGHSSTENLFDRDSGLRQAKALPGQVWESLVSGAIGTHLFHWNDRNQYKENFFLRERGFGIVEQNRKPKGEVYTNIVRMFRRMEELRLDSFLGGSSNPPPDVHIFWSTNSDMVWPKANQENATMWGALKRLGHQPGIIDDTLFAQKAWTNARVLLLSRAPQLEPQQLEALSAQVLPAGVHIHANADLPGQYDRYLRPNPNWPAIMDSVFGIGVSRASRGLASGVIDDYHGALALQGGPPLAGAGGAYSAVAHTWQIWHGVATTSGRTIATHTGWTNSQPSAPALVLKEHGAGRGKAAVNTFAAGDSYVDGFAEQSWNFRYDWLRGIYRGLFGVTPPIQLSGSNASFVIPDYRILRNGSVLLSVLNEHTRPASVTIASPLMAGKTVENLTSGGVMERNSDGVVALDLGGDDYVLLYLYDSGPNGATALHQSGPARVWFESAPAAVHPRAEPYVVEAGFDLQGGAELILSMESRGGVAWQSVPKAVSGRGRETLELRPPDNDPANAEYRSSPEGGTYHLRVALRSGMQTAAESRVPVRLAWPVRPVGILPLDPAPGRDYAATMKWEELPSLDAADPTPFDRNRLWDRVNLNRPYAIVLGLRDTSGQIVAESAHLAREGSGTNDFRISVPAGAQTPLVWLAEARPVLAQVSHDVRESFEGHERGAKWPDSLATDFLAPWTSFTYASPGAPLWQNEGVQLGGSDGSQAAFMVATNPPGLEVGSFGLIHAFPGGLWALPEDRKEWGRWMLAFDFKEVNGRACELELQVKNPDPAGPGIWIQRSASYVPGPDKWFRFAATLDQFAEPRGMEGLFDPGRVGELVLSVRMLEPSAQYVGIFDNVVFDGPDTVLATGPALGNYLGANDTIERLSIAREGRDRIVISWEGPNRLEMAESLSGEWTEINGARSGQPVPVGKGSRFYRLKR